MQLALMLGYSGGRLDIPIERIKLAEQLGFDSVWTAEAYGSDAMTPLAWIAAQTDRIKLGTGIIQLAGRAPAMAAMQAQTIDALAGGGRMIVGLGVSGPQIVEGWYGQPWGKPYWRLRDYIQIMQKIFAREEPVTHDGREYQLPFTGEGTIGLGKPLTSILHTNPDLPIYLGSGSEATVKLTAELCDGWLPMHFVPGRMAHFRPWIEEGFRRANTVDGELVGNKGWQDFDIVAQCPVQITDDVESIFRRAKGNIALYAGGMGHKDVNFHNQHMVQRGYADVAARVQELYLAGHKQEAADAIPDEYVDDAGLYGSPERISQRYLNWADSGVTGMNINTTQDEAVRLMAELAGTNRSQES
ncbi:MAG: LLM class F420-dependent oxidoreductase [Acidimicrobiales bacterium]|jgi:F420-dependent oxidoreductase-like protein